MSKEIAVSVNNLTKKFGDFTAVSDISFQVEKGEIFGFLGANGAGKSTTIKMLCGILPPTSGEAKVAGYDILAQAGLVRQNIGYMSQKFSLYDELTVYENVKFFAKLYSVSSGAIKGRIEEIISMVNLQDFKKIKSKSLSSGIKQRLSLACAIIHNPPIIFLDEPTSGVDPISRRNFWDLIYSFAEKNITVFVTTHYMDEAEYCDRIAMIGNGILREIGTPEELKNEKMIWDVIQVEGGDLYAVVKVLRKVPGIFDVGLMSDFVRVLSKDLTASDISEILMKNGLKDSAAQPCRATLEDVFVSLSGRAQ